MWNYSLDELKKVYEDLSNFEQIKIPLCAAETYISDFVKQGLSSEFEGKYIQGYKDRIVEKDNIGSDFLLPLLELVEKLCTKLYGANYADSRTLSGMNTLMIVFMSLLNKDEKVLITSKASGGHPSALAILEHLDIEYDYIPFNFKKLDIDYMSLNSLLKKNRYQAICFCQSDLIQAPNLNKIIFPTDLPIIYDASQTLGLIASKLLKNPLDYSSNVLLIGGTHKTLPGPTCGLIMTNSQKYREKIDFTISPTLLRNIQPNNIAALCLALIEQEIVGDDYQNNIVSTANKLGSNLENFGIMVHKTSKNKFTQTHQLFLNFDEKTTDRLYKNALKYNITLNKRNSELFTGIRIGVQEIARYKFDDETLSKVANLIKLISLEEAPEYEIRRLCSDIVSKKRPHYVIGDLFME